MRLAKTDKEAEIMTPTPLLETKVIKKLTPNVKITFNLNSNATVFKKLIIGMCVVLRT